MAMKSSKKFTGVLYYILQNGDISYRIGYTDPIDKKYKTEKIGLKSQGITEQYCYNKRSEILNQLRLGENPLQKFKSKVTFDSIAQPYFIDLEKRSRAITPAKIELCLYNLHIKPIFEHRNVYSITSKELDDLIDKKVIEGKSKSTIRHIIILISTIFNYAIRQEVFSGKNPVIGSKIKSIKVNNARERFLDKDEVEILLNDNRLKKYPFIEQFIRLSLSTGARLSTILEIQKKDINITTRSVVLKNLKTDSIYHGFLSEYFFPDLGFLRVMKPNDYVIHLNGNKVTRINIQRRLKKILDELFNEGLDKKDARNRVVVHTLRHSFASILAMNGTPMYRIQKLLDHKDATMTQRYAKLSPDSSFDAVNSMFS